MKRMAMYFRKLADLCDPKVGPSEEFVIRVTADTSDAEQKIGHLADIIDSVRKELAACEEIRLQAEGLIDAQPHLPVEKKPRKKRP